MMRSLFAGISGMRSHQIKMDIVGSNIANVNTHGFKASRVTFSEALVQNLRGASRANPNRGGLNPIQIGHGVRVGSIDTVFTQGAFEMTGGTTDLAINGDGFFVLGSGAGKSYTRVGNFDFDATGRLVSTINGNNVQGVMADTNGNLGLVSVLEDIRIPLELQSPAQATTRVAMVGNLDARLADGESVDLLVTIHDSLGTMREVTLTFTKAGVNSWTWEATEEGGGSAGTGTATFTTEGELDDMTPDEISYTPTNGSAPIEITLNPGLGTLSGLTQYGEPSTAYARAEDGYTYGTLADIDIDDSGYVNGSFTNGEVRVLARLAIARFDNPEGLKKVGGSMMEPSANSGPAIHLYAGDYGDITIAPGFLEMSNVDLTREFADLIVTQRGFQASARVISVSDELLAEVANIKR